MLARDRAGVSRVIEVGLGAAPTQANMFRATLALDPSRLDPPAVYNVEAERKAVFHLYDAESVEAPPPAPVASSPIASSPVASSPVATSKGPIADAPLTVRDSLLTLLALKARVRADEIRPDESVEQLFGGNSSKRNQVMADLGAEFGVGAIDGAHEAPFTALVDALQRATNGRYRAQGPYLRAQIAAALKPFALSTRDALSTLTARGLPEGRSLSLLNRVALWLRAGDSTRAGALSPVAPPKPGDRAGANAWLDGALAQYAREEGISLGGASSDGGAATVDAAALEKLLARYFGVGGAFLESLRFAEAALGRDVWAELEVKPEATEESDRLARYDTEHGEGYERSVRPAFASEKAVVFTGSWAWARREALALFHALRAGEADEARVRDASKRIARGADEATVRTVSWLRDRAVREGDPRAAEVFEALTASVDPKALPRAESDAAPRSPAVEVRPDGRLEDFERPRGEQHPLAVAEELVAGGHARLRAHGAERDGVAALFEETLFSLARGDVSFAGRTALVTGASDRSIAIELVKLLLTGGARVVVTTS